MGLKRVYLQGHQLENVAYNDKQFGCIKKRKSWLSFFQRKGITVAVGKTDRLFYIEFKKLFI
nr:hypothetical protein Ef18B006LT_35690 [Escherichia fergusonii]